MDLSLPAVVGPTLEVAFQNGLILTVDFSRESLPYLSGILYVTYDVKYGQIPSSFRYRETVVTVRTQKYGLIPQEA
jgi:hypothetical protein